MKTTLILQEPYTAWKQSPWATCLPLIVWVYLLSNFRDALWKTHHLCSRVRYGRSRSSKVIDCGSIRKGMWDCLLLLGRLKQHGNHCVTNCWSLCFWSLFHGFPSWFIVLCFVFEVN